MNGLLVSPAATTTRFQAIRKNRVIKGAVIVLALIGVLIALYLLWHVGAVSHAIAGPGSSWA
jgi:ABC-type enterochelin transport system permease subunit